MVNISEDALAVVELAITAMEEALKVTTQHTQRLKQAMDDAVEVCRLQSCPNNNRQLY